MQYLQKQIHSDSKGMVIINETSEGEKEVLLNLFDGDPTRYDRDSIIFFP